MNFFTLILTIIIIILILSVAYYFYRAYEVHHKKQAMAQALWPPAQYMKTVGSLCPDYWSYEGPSADGTHLCRNRFNIPVANPGSKICYDRGQDGKVFSTLGRWPPKREDVQGRCEWMKHCGPADNIPGSWIGMNRYC